MCNIEPASIVTHTDEAHVVMFTFQRSGEVLAWEDTMRERSPVLAKKHNSATTKDGFTEELDARGHVIVDDDLYHPRAVQVLIALMKGGKPSFVDMETCQLLDAVRCVDFFGLPDSSAQVVTAALLANISGPDYDSLTVNVQALPLRPPLLLSRLQVSNVTLRNLVLPDDENDSILIEEVEVSDSVMEKCTLGEAAALSSIKVQNSSLVCVDLFAHALTVCIYSTLLTNCKLRTTGILTIHDSNQINDTVFPEDMVDGSQCQLIMKSSSVVSDILLPFCYVTLEDVTFGGSVVIGQTKEKGRSFNFVKVTFRSVTFRESGTMSFDSVQFTESVDFVNGVHCQLVMKNMPNLADIAMPFYDITLDTVTFSGHVVLGKQDSRGRSFKFSRVTFGRSSSFGESDAMSFEDVVFEDSASFTIGEARSGQSMEMDFCNVIAKCPMQLHDVTITSFKNVQCAEASSFKNVTFRGPLKDCKFTVGTEFVDCSFQYGIQCSTAVGCSFKNCRMDTHFPSTWFSLPRVDQLITNSVFLKCNFVACTFLHAADAEMSYQEAPYFTHKLHSNFSRSILKGCFVHAEQLTVQKAKDLCLYHCWNMHGVQICVDEDNS